MLQCKEIQELCIVDGCGPDKGLPSILKGNNNLALPPPRTKVKCESSPSECICPSLQKTFEDLLSQCTCNARDLYHSSTEGQQKPGASGIGRSLTGRWLTMQPRQGLSPHCLVPGSRKVGAKRSHTGSSLHGHGPALSLSQSRGGTIMEHVSKSPSSYDWRFSSGFTLFHHLL